MTKGRPKSTKSTATDNISLRITPEQKKQLLNLVNKFNDENGTEISISAFVKMRLFS